jgi:FlaA1/EpsC-like NDP-sugar epimerase
MAEKLIRLSGLEPYTDIEIKEIGLRPGEKLYEELLTDNDNLLRTANDKIFVEQVELIPEAEMMEKLETLDKALQDDISPEDLIRLLKEMVPTYKAPEQVNDRLAGK